MKSESCHPHVTWDKSLPAWGVRVEIYERLNRYYKNYSHSPHGECGLKLDMLDYSRKHGYVTPRMGSAG